MNQGHTLKETSVKLHSKFVNKYSFDSNKSINQTQHGMEGFPSPYSESFDRTIPLKKSLKAEKNIKNSKI